MRCQRESLSHAAKVSRDNCLSDLLIPKEIAGSFVLFRGFFPHLLGGLPPAPVRIALALIPSACSPGSHRPGTPWRYVFPLGTSQTAIACGVKSHPNHSKAHKWRRAATGYAQGIRLADRMNSLRTKTNKANRSSFRPHFHGIGPCGLPRQIAAAGSGSSRVLARHLGSQLDFTCRRRGSSQSAAWESPPWACQRSRPRTAAKERRMKRYAGPWGSGTRY